MVNLDEMNKVRKWEQLVLNENRLTILMILKERTLVSQTQAQKVLWKTGKKISWSSVHRHFKILEASGLVSRSTYPVLEPDKDTKSSFGTPVGYRLTAEAKDFLNSLRGKAEELN